jgi:hypothetical protein
LVSILKGTIDHHIKWESIAAKITESVFNKKEKNRIDAQ